jgi:TrmH family RNA methyltransferase
MITSRENRRLKDIRRLRRSKGAKKGDRVLLEGPHLLEEALQCQLPLEEVLMSAELLASQEGRHLAARLPQPPLEVESRLLRGLTDADAPQGVLAVVSLPRGGVETVPRRPGGLYLYADGVQDPGNLGALARVAEAAGAAALVLGPGSVHPNHPRAQRAGAGSLLRLPTAVAVAAVELDRHLAELAPRWLALVPRSGESPWRLEAGGTLVVAVGAEGHGLSPGLAERAQQAVTIPLAPPVESLNVATAAAVVLFELSRRRGGAGATGGDAP